MTSLNRSFSLPPLAFLLSVTLGASQIATRFEGFPKFSAQGNPVTISQHQKSGSPLAALNSAPAQAVESKALPLEWLLGPKLQSLPHRILARLVQSEAHEANPHFRDDYRQTFIALSLAIRGENIPFIQASYLMYGLHPDKVWPAIVAKRAALLGRAGEVIPLSASPAKPSQVVSIDSKEKRLA